MGKGNQNTSSNGGNDSVKQHTWQEITQHDKRHDKWIVIDNEVYDITEWSKRHPGGSKVISHYAGQDATHAFHAFHSDISIPKKYLKIIHKGPVQASNIKTAAIDTDFQNLRETVNKMGMFKPSYTFYTLNLLHVVVLDVLAYFVLRYFGTGWLPLLTSLIFTVIVQIQSAYLAHDFGHTSVFGTKYKIDDFMERICMGFMKGASAKWWNHMHFQHHAKPNVLNKDPDTRLDALFVVGDVMPAQIAEKKKNSMPYDWQHRYFPIIGPPFLFPVYFLYALNRHIFTRREYLDFFFTVCYWSRFFYLYGSVLGFGTAVAFQVVMRVFESSWFTWVSQSNHIPMKIEEDDAKPWLRLQLNATCNVQPSFFNDWFTGHLDFQIEHHLFPTMPRHNLYKIAPIVKSLCEKHNLSYQVKPLFQSFTDILKSLKRSGGLWKKAYTQFHGPNPTNVNNNTSE
ncbi:acyl-CoA 6-desaturase [Patella vulgata]|uniref:acyl-CoA 6-desaturase n=1 Tax=Patella vulgata TaxID=6465 RepID=UPI0024A7D842|nr:acyl-CoA 6-desaturase [Patella vulgata]